MARFVLAVFGTAMILVGGYAFTGFGAPENITLLTLSFGGFLLAIGGASLATANDQRNWSALFGVGAMVMLVCMATT